ncbi:MAG TPA: M28 family peptidase, partial [Pyrinomonadaceae bacterium]|nr:M28 family peptidase [Pyrinomonadaceae bacterium]
SILETLRALKSSQPLRNDVIALFSDAEEVGMRGALAFVYQHPWAKDVGVVLNFDARGNSGPVIMFETSRNNSWLIREFAKVAPHPSANSLAPAVYGLMPNKTDMTVFKEAGLAGLNFAYLVGSRHYHNPLDNLTSIDHRSIQHQGSTALALTRHFGNLNLTTTAQGNEVYFDVLNLTIISYAERLVVPLAVVVSLIFVVLVAFGFKNKHLTGLGLVAGFMAVPLSVIAAVLIMIPLRRLLIAISPQQSNLDLVFFVVITICVLLVVNAKFGRLAGISNLMVGCYLWSLIFLVLTSLLLKGGSYLFTWSLLFNLGALAFVLARKQGEILSVKQLILLVLGAVPGIILFVPLFYLTSVALTLRSFVALFAVAGIMVLLLGPLTPHFAVVAAIRKAFHTVPNS